MRCNIQQLSQRLVMALGTDAHQPSGRVRDVPDIRTIRYYTTLGLLAPPSEFRGRTALYGPLHLKQLVAIKRLQLEGRSLVEIQQRLAGIPEDELTQLAAVPEAALNGVLPLEPTESCAPAASGAKVPPRPPLAQPAVDAACALPQKAAPIARAAFWSSPVTTAGQPPKAAVGTNGSAVQNGHATWGSSTCLHFAPGVSLLLENVSLADLPPEQLAALQQSLAPFVELLQKNGVIPRPPEEKPVAE